MFEQARQRTEKDNIWFFLLTVIWKTVSKGKQLHANAYVNYDWKWRRNIKVTGNGKEMEK